MQQRTATDTFWVDACVYSDRWTHPYHHNTQTQHTDVFRIADDGKRGVALFGA